MPLTSYLLRMQHLAANLKQRLKQIANDPTFGGWGSSVIWSIPVVSVTCLLGLLRLATVASRDPFYVVAYVVLLGGFWILIGLILGRRIAIPHALLSLSLLFSLYFLSKLTYTLFIDPNLLTLEDRFLENFYFLPLVFIITSFLAHDRLGRIVASFYFFGLLLLSLGYIFLGTRSSDHGIISYALSQIIMANLGVYVLTTNVFGFRKRVNDVQNRADSLELLATNDNLTKLGNRLALAQNMAQLLATRQLETKIALVFIDLDGFKSVNDTYGHEAGDMLLREVANCLNQAKRHEDSVYRLSGDEFVYLFPNLPTNTDVRVLGERIYQKLKRTFLKADLGLDVSASIGIALCPDDGETLQTLLKRADQAMYMVKHSGKNGVAVASAEIAIQGHAGTKLNLLAKDELLN